MSMAERKRTICCVSRAPMGTQTSRFMRAGKAQPLSREALLV
jgi:hypothetical protein